MADETRAPTEDEVVAADTEAATDQSLDDAPAGPVGKAERLEAKAARLRAREEERRASEQERRQAREARANEPARRADSGLMAALGGIVGLLVIGLAVSLVLLVRQHHDTDRAQQRAATAQQQLDQMKSGGSGSALDAARRYSVEVASYNYQSLDQGFAQMTTHLTPTFRQRYESTVAGLKATILKYKGKATATVQAAAISAATPTTATALIFIDQTVSSSQSSAATVNRNRMEMQLKLVNGAWLIDGLVLV